MKQGNINWLFLCSSVAIMLLVSMVGCGRSSTQVTGKVVYEKDGTPMEKGIVTFVSASGKIGQGELQKDGTFTLRSGSQKDGLQPGKYGVCVTPPDMSSARENGLTVPQLIDERFLSTETSGLQFEVKPGKNDFTIKVSKPAGG